MVILITLGVLAALLYHWLTGHWFARVLVFLPLIVICSVLTTLPLKSMGDIVQFGTIPLGIAIAWIIASLPIYYHRSEEERRRRETSISLARAE